MAICKGVGHLLPKRMKKTRKNPTEYQAPSPSPNTKKAPIPKPLHGFRLVGLSGYCIP